MFKDIGDMTKMLGQAQNMHKEQQHYQDKHMRILEEILKELKEIKAKLK
jgi:hypothetical protein